MEIKNIDGNLLDSDAELILHQVNCMGVMNSGVAKAIRKKWPIVYVEYMKLVNYGLYGSEKTFNREKLLGCAQKVEVNENQKVVNLFGQFGYGYDGKCYTNYDAVILAIQNTASYCEKNGIKKIALPWHMSCDRGGGNWEKIMEIIESSFKDLDIVIEIWKLK